MFYRLVDLDDHRLYSARARGRNQVEPSPLLDDIGERKEQANRLLL